MPERKQASLCTDCLDVGTRELILAHDVFLQVNVFSKGHLTCVDVENPPLGLLIGHWKLNFPVNPARSEEGRIQCVNSVSRHHHLGLSPIVEAIQLVEKLQHSSLDFSFPTTVALVPFGADGVNLINEDDTWAVLICNSEQLAHQLRSISKILLDQLAANHSEEGGTCLISNSLGQQSFSSTRWAVQDNSFRRHNSHLPIVLRVR